MNVTVVDRAIREELCALLQAGLARAWPHWKADTGYTVALRLDSDDGQTYRIGITRADSGAVEIVLDDPRRRCARLDLDLRRPDFFERAAERLLWAFTLEQERREMGLRVAEALAVRAPLYGWTNRGIRACPGTNGVESELALSVPYPRGLGAAADCLWTLTPGPEGGPAILASRQSSRPGCPCAVSAPAAFGGLEEAMERFRPLTEQAVEQFWAKALPFESLLVPAEDKQALLVVKPYLLACEVRTSPRRDWPGDLVRFCLKSLDPDDSSPTVLLRRLFFLLLATELAEGGPREALLASYGRLCDELVARRKHDGSLPYSPMFPYRRFMAASPASPEAVLSAVRLAPTPYEWFIREATLEQIVELTALA